LHTASVTETASAPIFPHRLQSEHPHLTSPKPMHVKTRHAKMALVWPKSRGNFVTRKLFEPAKAPYNLLVQGWACQPFQGDECRPAGPSSRYFRSRPPVSCRKFFVNMAVAPRAALEFTACGLERRRRAIVHGTNRLQYARHCNAARCVAGLSADAFEAHCLMTDRKILGSKYCAAVRGFSILATRV
jgi:hypothetical protein